LFSNRKPPTAAYAMAPVFHMLIEDDAPLFVGGSFWDGRATGERLGDPLAEQAQGPFVNPVEQALPDTACVVRRVCLAKYPVTLESLFPGSCAIAWPVGADAACALPKAMLQMTPLDRSASNRAFDHIATAVAAYERSREVNPFSSKFDRYLAAEAVLSPEEQAGLELFNGRGKCSACHPLDKGANGAPPLLTDFTFDNLGIPRNPENPWYRVASNSAGATWVDDGLGAFLSTRPEWRQLAAANVGKHKVPTLRNVDRRPPGAFVKAYMHNAHRFRAPLLAVIRIDQRPTLLPRSVSLYPRQPHAEREPLSCDRHRPWGGSPAPVVPLEAPRPRRTRTLPSRVEGGSQCPCRQTKEQGTRIG
jgi:cytochrome c peroxidase